MERIQSLKIFKNVMNGKMKTQVLNIPHIVQATPGVKEATYLSSLFCRIHPSIISFTSGIATLSKLAGFTP